MGAFEFFFSFYGLLLGFSVAELVGGFARLIHERKAVRFGLLTPLLGLFVAIDIASYWVQAWLALRNAPFNYALLIIGLLVASIFYVAATLVFPREPKEWPNLDAHFWTHRRWVLLSVVLANTIMLAVVFSAAARAGEMHLVLHPVAVAGISFFTLATLAAALAPWRRVVLGLLAALVLYQGWGVVRAGVRLLEGPAWSLVS